MNAVSDFSTFILPSYLLLCTGMAVSISSFPGGMILCLFLGSLDGEAAQPP